MSDPDNTPAGGKKDWEGFREVDRAIAENRLTSYTWKRLGQTHGASLD